MAGRELTEDQRIRKEKLIEEFKIKAMQIKESDPPHNILDGGGGPFHDLGLEFQKRLKEIISE